MKSKTATWYEAKIRYDKTMDDGLQKSVTELYVNEALTFGEAEESIIKEMEPYISGEFKVTALKIAPYGEVFFSENEKDDKWFKAKLQFITVDDFGKEKKSNVYYLVQAKDIDTARKYVTEAMGGTMADYNIAALVETKIMDVFEHHVTKITTQVQNTNTQNTK